LVKPAWWRLALAFVAGGVAVCAFAPLNAWPLMLLSLVVLFVCWLRSATPAQSAAIGFAWAFGLFVFGVPWLFVSLHTYGGMPAWMAAMAVVCFCVYLSAYTALAGWLQAKWFATRTSLIMRLSVVMPAFLVIGEVLRGWVVSGFPWLTVGYTQTPSAFGIAPLAGWAAIFGAFGVSLLLAISAGSIVLLSQRLGRVALTPASRRVLMSMLGLIWIGGVLLGSVSWSRPSGEPIAVSLLQGNIEQSLKFRADQLQPTINRYLDLLASSKGQLIVLPETAIPLLLEDYPAALFATLADTARARGGDVLVGVAFRTPRSASESPSRAFDVFNGAVAVSDDGATQRYAKAHLVAFGEFVPPLFSWVMQWLNIPMSGFTPGGETQASMRLSGHFIAVNICYEDAFGRGIARAFPGGFGEASGTTPQLMVNLTNMAWFGKTWAADQHAQMSQMRALETSRWMLRATNTGVTAAIDERGRTVATLPQWQSGVLDVMAQPRDGRTPYVLWRDWAVMLILALMLVSTGLRARP
jgi:apolipoprotein N-acyltransferase